MLEQLTCRYMKVETDIGTASQRHNSRSNTRDNTRLKKAFLLILMHYGSYRHSSGEELVKN